MLNHKGGQVLFGVTPEGRVAGQQVSERTIEKVSDDLARIEPPISPTIERVAVKDDLEIVVVSVNRGAARPYRYRDKAYRRVGNTTRAMGAEGIQPGAVRAHAQRTALGEPAGGRMVIERISTRTRSG